LTVQSYPHQLLDDGRKVYFGQNLQEVECTFATTAIDIPSRIARAGIDKKIVAQGISLQFDTERLNTIEFSKDYRFKNPAKPYSQSWKNFEVIGDLGIKGRMDRDDFIAYLAAWEFRARELGAEKVDLEDLVENQYRFSFDKDQFADMFHLAMGPSRRAGGGGMWADGWTAFFTAESDASAKRVSGGKLESLCAFCDEFNTVAKRRS